MLKNSDKTPKQLVKELGLEQVSDEGAIAAIVDEVLAENPQSVADYKAGKDKAIGFLQKTRSPLPTTKQAKIKLSASLLAR